MNNLFLLFLCALPFIGYSQDRYGHGHNAAKYEVSYNLLRIYPDSNFTVHHKFKVKWFDKNDTDKVQLYVFDYTVNDSNFHFVIIYNVELRYASSIVYVPYFLRSKAHKITYVKTIQKGYPLIKLSYVTGNRSEKWEKVEIIDLMSKYKPVVALFYENYQLKIPEFELNKLEEGSLIKKTNFLKFERKKYLKTSQVTLRTVTQKYKPKDCSCEDGMENRIKETKYLFINGEFVLFDEE